ncbi:shikimate dehydrogenase [Paenibacillus albiflavus]|uniref:Shikimate dehydrogenase (NADP(+)) n=1 Tax=Paenibacillus albiflavus TaxID=2545760 RepID=A0A4R4EDG3_9BACL|nr:shikimate dehydrogenase [Paenibacillus albiflavus]TCZ77050.1 shikimate dehydrogenase [Paenibacillus albiflavus]
MGKQLNQQGINSDTVLYGVLGDPIRHSRSPIMIGRAFREMGINAAYAAFRVEPQDLSAAVQGIRALGLGGANVTIPHKIEVMRYLDEIDEGARVAGAVNTIVNKGGRLIGYNTDGIGYVRSLKNETGASLAGARVLMLGAGGAARGVAYALAREGVSRIYIANRTLERAVELADLIGEYTSAVGLRTADVGDIMREVDIVVNTTSVGMSPNVDETPLPAELLHNRLIVSDLIYNPQETRLLREAALAGATAHGGLGMFIYQGAYAFELWTGQPAPTDAMREVVLESFNQTI